MDICASQRSAAHSFADELAEEPRSWIRDRIFPFFAPLVARELQRQYAAVLGV
jgi:hypothetical protein